MGPDAIVKIYGYKGRCSWVNYYKDGLKKDIPDSVLLGLGFIKYEKDEDEGKEFEPPKIEEENFWELDDNCKMSIAEMIKS